MRVKSMGGVWAEAWDRAGDVGGGWGGGWWGDGGGGGMGSGGEREHRVESGVEDRAVGGMGLGHGVQSQK